MTAIESELTPAVAAEPVAGRWSRWSDRLNPILVREVQQAVKGRMFVVTVLIVLLAIVIIATTAVGGRVGRDGAGRDVFDAGLAVLAPLLVFVVPMQAYQSMRLELRAGIVEQLLMSRLRPRSIVAGKLLAAMVQFALYVSLLAPLLATSYLLRGVDLPTIGLSLCFALVICVSATACAISAAAQGMVPALQGIANVGVAFGLGMLSFMLLAYCGSGEYAREIGQLIRSSEFGAITSAMVLVGCASTALSALVAQSFLMHTFENRSTGFRVFLFAMVALAVGWVLLFIDPSDWVDALPYIVFMLALLGTVFGVFMVTEQSLLSPRVHAHVPRHPLLAQLAAPFLPGRDRGMTCLVGYFALLAVIGWLVWPAAVASGSGFLHFEETALVMSVMTAIYALVWLTIARLVRTKMPSSVLGNHAARFLLPLLLMAACIGPLLIDAFVRRGVDDWHMLHALNPFWTIAEFAGKSRTTTSIWSLMGLLAVLVVLQLPCLLRGGREVAAAAAARRARAAEANVGA